MHLSADLAMRRALGGPGATGLSPGAAPPDLAGQAFAEFLADLRPYVNAVDGPPAEYHDLMVAAFTFRRMDAELVELLEDSALSGYHSGVRSGLVADHGLRFRLEPGVHLEVEILADRVVAELDGAVMLRAWCHTDQATTELQVEDEIALELLHVPAGPFCFEIETPSQRVVTDWLLA